MALGQRRITVRYSGVVARISWVLILCVSFCPLRQNLWFVGSGYHLPVLVVHLLYIILLGAEMNAELQLQTAVDTTTGRPKPMGKRGAFVADHVQEGLWATDVHRARLPCIFQSKRVVRPNGGI